MSEPGMDYDPQGMVLRVDESILLVDKPAGLLSLPDGYDPSLPHLRSVLEPEFGRLWIVHRLDRDTSGVVLLARTAKAHRGLNDQFAARSVKKVYHALACETPDWDAMDMDSPLKVDGDRRHRTVIDHQHGVSARTVFRVLARFKDYSLVEAIPYTGRRHQVRAHLASLGHPVAVDSLYGGGNGVYPPGHSQGAQGFLVLERMALHARSLEFAHPITQSQEAAICAYPRDLQDALDQLGKFNQPS